MNRVRTYQGERRVHCATSAPTSSKACYLKSLSARIPTKIKSLPSAPPQLAHVQLRCTFWWSWGKPPPSGAQCETSHSPTVARQVAQWGDEDTAISSQVIADIPSGDGSRSASAPWRPYASTPQTHLWLGQTPVAFEKHVEPRGLHAN